MCSHKGTQKIRYKLISNIYLYNEFSLGVYISKEDIKSRLKRIYTQFGIKHKVTQSTIEDYYEAYNSQSKKPPSYKLIRFKYDGTIFEAPP